MPLRLQLDNPPEWVEVRGEAFIPDNTFAEINAERESRGEALFANPRNACAGTLRQLDPKVVAARRLDFFAYTLHLPAQEQPASQWAALTWLEEAGFRVNPNHRWCGGEAEQLGAPRRSWLHPKITTLGYRPEISSGGSAKSSASDRRTSRTYGRNDPGRGV